MNRGGCLVEEGGLLQQGFEIHRRNGTNTFCWRIFEGVFHTGSRVIQQAEFPHFPALDGAFSIQSPGRNQ